MRGIDHPNVVKLVSFSESDEFYFLVLECKLALPCSQTQLTGSDGGR